MEPHAAARAAGPVTMLFDPQRHEPLAAARWDAPRVHAAIEAIVRDTEARFRRGHGWPVHANDLAPGDDAALPSTTLYFGAAGVAWALRYLNAVGAVTPRAPWREDWAALCERNRATLARWGDDSHGSYLMGDLPIAMLALDDDAESELASRVPALLEGNMLNPARELMWGAPGSLLAAAFLHERSGDARWADRYRALAAQLQSELLWSEVHGCHYWAQDLYGQRVSYLDAVHGFVATARALLRGRHLLAPHDWQTWQHRIARTIARTAHWEGDGVNWPAELIVPAGRAQKTLMQFCHGAPGFVICLADWPDGELDELLLAAGRATWAAGPLSKGSNLCHGTAGNGYTFLKLFERTGEGHWLDKARAFAMHALAQCEADAAKHGQGRYSLWTGDLGLAVYLWDCLRGQSAFPTLDVFYA